MTKKILVTGASGTVGSRLVPLLLERGYTVRVLVRAPCRLDGYLWSSQVEQVVGDLLDENTLAPLLNGITAAFYLVHNMSSGAHYELRERRSARNLARAAGQAGLEQIIYLGGLAHAGEPMGFHMQSRLRTGDELRLGRVPVTEFRASLVIASGSISFEMIRGLAEQFPLLVGPRTLRTKAQPIDLQDVLAYLLTALELPSARGRIFEIGGSQVLSYAGALLEYARQRGLKRFLLLLPWLPAWFMAAMVDVFIPIPSYIAGPLIGGMRGNSTVYSRDAEIAFPDIHPKSYRESVQLALQNLTPEGIDQSWRHAAGTRHFMQEGFFIDHRTIHVPAAPQKVFAVVSSLGGENGWLAWNFLWKLRGLLDRLAGGPGMRGRSSAQSLSENDFVDYYRLEVIRPGRMLRLRAELKAPGQGWMEWQTLPDGAGTRLTQTGYFAPKGLPGYLYWYGLWPVHSLVFERLIRAIRRKAVALGDG